METQSNIIKYICIIGVGGIGGYFGGKLALCGDYHVSFLARGSHLEAIKKWGLILNTVERSGLVCKPALATDSFEEIPIPDLCLICVKGYDLAGAAESFKKRIKPGTHLIPLLNGIDIYERMRRVLSTGIIHPACVYIGSRIEKPGVVAQTGGSGIILFGKDPKHPQDTGESIFPVFEKAGIRYEWHRDPNPVIWIKFIFIASFGLVSAYSGKTLGEIREDRELNNLVHSMAQEITAIAEAKKVILPDNIVESTLKKADTFPYDTKSSYQRDVEKKDKPNEGDLFGGAIIRLGEELGIETPYTDTLYAAIQKRSG